LVSVMVKVPLLALVGGCVSRAVEMPLLVVVLAA